MPTAFAEGGGVRPRHAGDPVVPGHHLCCVGCFSDMSKLPFRRDCPLWAPQSSGSRGQVGRCEAERPHVPWIWGCRAPRLAVVTRQGPASSPAEGGGAPSALSLVLKLHPRGKRGTIPAARVAL